MVKVAYVVKKEDGYLKDISIKFDSMQDAIRHIRLIQNKYNTSKEYLIGKPAIERI